MATFFASAAFSARSAPSYSSLTKRVWTWSQRSRQIHQSKRHRLSQPAPISRQCHQERGHGERRQDLRAGEMEDQIVRKLSLMFAVAAALLFPVTTFAGQHHDHDRHSRGHWSSKAPPWFPQLPIECFPASRADNGPDNQGPPPMPDVEEH